MPVNTSITFRKGSATQWSNTNPVLASGEPGYDLTNNILKIGDGVSNWNNLKNVASSSGLISPVSGEFQNLLVSNSFTVNPESETNLQNTLTIDTNNYLTITNVAGGMIATEDSSIERWSISQCEINGGSGNFASLKVNNTGVSISGHSHSSSDITDAIYVSGIGQNSIRPRLGNSVAIGESSVVGGGRQNITNGNYAVVAGGDGNVATNAASIVGGGLGNSAANAYSIVAGGQENIAVADYSVIAGGLKNIARGSYSYIGAGINNSATSANSNVHGISNVAAQKVRRVNNIPAGTTTSTITVLNASSSDFDNTSAGSLEIRYFTTSAGWQQTTRTVSAATQNGADVTLVLTSSVGGAPEWTNITVINIAESDSSAGQVVAGTSNIACGLFDVVAGGIGNSAISDYGFIGGGNGNLTAGSQAIVVGGASNSANNGYATVVGGLNNSATGERSFIGGGANNAASASYAIVIGGQDSIASALHSNVLGGLGNSATGDYSAIIGGARGKVTKFGEIGHAAGRFANPGDAQHCMMIARRTTTDATPNLPLFLNGTTQRLTIPAQTAWTFSIKLCCYSSTDNASAWWFFRGGIRRNNSNNTILVGSIISENGAEESLNSTTASVVADDTNDALEIRVTGINGKNIRWVAVIDISQVSFGAP